MHDCQRNTENVIGIFYALQCDQKQILRDEIGKYRVGGAWGCEYWHQDLRITGTSLLKHINSFPLFLWNMKHLWAYFSMLLVD